MGVRRPAVAGSWYPAAADALVRMLDGYLAPARQVEGELRAVIAPHAGLMYSGPVAAHAYRLLAGRAFDTIVLVGPSHFETFEGVAVFPEGGFATPLGMAEIDSDLSAALVRATRGARLDARPHAREHSLEMQLPFVRHLAPDARIVAALMGAQTAETARRLGDGLADVLTGRPALLVASTDLSHYQPAAVAARLDTIVIEQVGAFDADGLQRVLDRRPDHACGGGPTVAVMRAAHRLGARDARVLEYADSGDVSGDKSSVVGYLAAAFGGFGGEEAAA